MERKIRDWENRSLAHCACLHMINKFPTDNSLYWLDDCDERVCLTFPAVLNLKGAYSRMGSYFTLFDELKVSFYLILTEEISSTSGFQKSITLTIYESRVPIIDHFNK